MTFGEALRGAIAAAGVSQNLAAKKAGIHQSEISKYIRGTRTPNLDHFIELCRAFPSLVKWFEAQLR